MMQRVTYEEMILLRLLELNYLMPHYWSELFMMSFQLLDPMSAEYKKLQEMIEDIELMVFSEEELNAGLSLYDIEMAFESNPDYYAYLERSDNPSVVITKFDIERKLNEIKQWIYQIVRTRAVGRKFRRYR